MHKVAIVGAGRVGETTAQILAEQETCREVVLIDIREDVPQGWPWTYPVRKTFSRP